MKKILLLLASPRKGGNTEALADFFAAGAQANGHQIEKVMLPSLKISPCLACDSCKRNPGKCVQKDDMQAIYEKYDNADVIVLATPLYFFNFPAQMKIAMDRFYAIYNGARPPKQAVLLAAYGSRNIHEADSMIAQYRMVASVLNWSILGEIVAGGVLNKGSIENHPALTEAKELGKKIL